jgi:hypothetical protein
MICYQPITFDSHGETFKYRLTKKRIFVTGHKLGNWELVTPNNEIVAKCDGSIVIAYPNYMWDGSTVIGKYYEDEETLEASLLHDILYNAKKNPDDINVPFNLFLADKLMLDQLLILYKNKNIIKRLLFSHLYYLGLMILGVPWKFGNNKFYRLKKAE